MSPDDFSEKIELLINDENRVVTYKILSHELKIHVNKAKQCMMDFLNAQKSKGIALEAHYFLAGFIEKDGIRMVKLLVVPEDKLESAKKSFSELSSFHIYSIHKGTPQDECALYSTDFTYIKDKEGQSKYSAIKHPDIQIQPPVLNKVNLNSDTSASLAKTLGSKANAPKIVPMNSKSESTKKVIENGISPEKNKEVKDSPNKDEKGAKSSPDAKKQKSGSLMSMWQKKEEKSNGIKKDNSKPEGKGKETAKTAPKNNILSMFSKQAVKNAEKPPMPKTSVTKVEETSKPAVLEVTERDDNVKTAKTNESKRSSQKRKIPNKQSKRSSKSKNDSDDSDSEFQKSKVKKHRRICTFDDSSESENEEEKEKQQRSFFLPEEPMDTAVATPVSEDEEPIPPTPPVIHVKGKAKVWKTVQKTYEDEEGFFVTKSEKELVSASEDEEDPLKTKPPVKKEDVFNKKISSVNKKQASLMSFFKQK